MTAATETEFRTSGLVRLTRPQLVGTLTGLLLAALLAAIDQTIVGTAEPRIIAQLSGFDRYPWIATAYLLTSTVSVPIFASLSDHPRAQAVLSAGCHALHADVRAVRRRRHADVPADRRHGPADSVPRPAGHRRRHGDGAAVHDRRRHLLAGRTRPLSRTVRGGVGSGVDLRTDAGRLADRPLVVARLLLGQSAGGRDRGRGDLLRVSPHEAARRRRAGSTGPASPR